MLSLKTNISERKSFSQNNKNTKNAEVNNKVLRHISANAKNKVKLVTSLLPRQEPNLKPWLQSAKKHPLPERQYLVLRISFKSKDMENGLLSSSHKFRAGNLPNQNRHLNQAPPVLQQPAQQQIIVKVGIGRLKLGVPHMFPKRKEKLESKTACLLKQLKILTSCLSKIPQTP